MVKRVTSLFNSFCSNQCCKTSCTFFFARFSTPFSLYVLFSDRGPGELDSFLIHKLCLHIHVNKTKFERNSIKYYHMTNTRPVYRVFSHDITAAILVSQNNEMAAMLVSQPILWELNSFLMQTLSFVPINLHRCRPRV